MNAVRDREAVNRWSGSTSAAAVALLVLSATCLPAARAAAQDAPREAPIFGVWPDIALSVGAGIGVDTLLDSNAFARLRAGALFAFEPWVLNVGATGEVGALAELGAGLELELNHMTGPWLQINASRVEPGRFMGHVGLGYFVFGVEWQHAFGEARADAVLFVLRLPIGLLWFMPNHAAASEAGH
jgi:hypothetical protein